MSDELSIKISWSRKEEALLAGKYSNAHDIIYNPTYSLIGDAAPDWGGNNAHTNPEQALAAALSSCHLMTFLAISAKMGWPVLSYQDHAVAHLGKNPAQQMSVTKIELNPVVTFDEGFSIDAEKLADMHERAHRYCFIANSLAEHVEMIVKS